MDDDPIAENFKAFLDGLSPVSTMEQHVVSPSHPMYTNEELIDIFLDDAPSPLPLEMYKKPQELNKSDGNPQHEGYLAAHHHMIRKNWKKKFERPRHVGNLKVVLERLKTQQREEKEQELKTKLYEYPWKPEKIAEKRKSIEVPRKSIEEEKKSSGDQFIKAKPIMKRRRRLRKMEMTVDEIREWKLLKVERQTKLKQLAETEKKRSLVEVRCGAQATASVTANKQDGAEENRKSVNNEKRKAAEKPCQSNSNHRSLERRASTSSKESGEQLAVTEKKRSLVEVRRCSAQATASVTANKQDGAEENRKSVNNEKRKAAEKPCQSNSNHRSLERRASTSSKESGGQLAETEKKRSLVEVRCSAQATASVTASKQDDAEENRKSVNNEKRKAAENPSQSNCNHHSLERRTSTSNKESGEKKATQEKCQLSVNKEKAATPVEKTIEKSKHRRPSLEKLPRSHGTHSDQKRRCQDVHDKSESKRPRSHHQEKLPVKLSTVEDTPRVAEITIKEEIVDLTEDTNTMCVNLKFSTISSQQLVWEVCQQLPVQREESIIKTEVEEYLFKATVAVACIGTQTTAFSTASSATSFAKTVAGFVRDFSVLNKTFMQLKTQLIEQLDGNVHHDMLIDELKELSQHFQKRFSKIGDKLCGRLSKVQVQNFDFLAVLGRASSHLAQGTPSILLTEHQIWQHLAAMLNWCCVNAPSKTFVTFLNQALKPPDEFESPEVLSYKKEIGWGENNVPFSIDNDTHEVPTLQFSIRAMPFQSPNQRHFFHDGEVIDLTI